MEEKKSETITIRKEDFWKYCTFLLLAVIIVGSFVVFTGKGPTTNTGTNPAPTNPSVAQPSVVSADVDDDAMLGDPNAPVTIIEFSDYQCPFCGRFYTQTYGLIKEEYVDTGKVKIVFRDFPLTRIHPLAQKAGEATECVREQGGDEAFWEMHDKIFENQASLSDSNLRAWGQELGYDINSCLDSNKYASEVSSDAQAAQAAGGSGTPYFVIQADSQETGQGLSGAQPFSAFKTIIDAELAK